MNVVDSSAWLEYLALGPNTNFFAPAVLATRVLIVPSITLYEIFKRVLQQRGEDAASDAVTIMQAGKVADLDGGLAIAAATFSHENGLPMADSIVIATVRAFDADIWTQDADFASFDRVHFRARAQRGE